MTKLTASHTKINAINNAKIAGTGSYLPQKILSNKDLEKMVDTTDEWIFSRTGIRERHIAATDEFTSDLALMRQKMPLKVLVFRLMTLI